jgi:hypothetical protein
MQHLDLSCIENNIVLQYQSHLVKIYLKTLESNQLELPKNYFANSRFVPMIDLLTFPPIGGTFFHIQDGSKPMSLVPKSRQKASLGTRMTNRALKQCS